MRSRSTTTLAFALLLLLSVPAVSQKITALTATAKGQGTIVISQVDKHQIKSVLVILKENGDADFTFYTDLQLTASGSWSTGGSVADGIDLKITGGVVTGNAKGTGKLFLRNDGKSIDKLNIKAESADGSKITIDFVADKSQDKSQ